MTKVALRHRYEPRGAARELFLRRDPEVLLSGPAGTGKSRSCLEKVHRMALLNPGLRALICRKTLASLGSTALVTWREHVAKEAIEAGDVVWYGGSPQEAAQYRYTNGSTITVGGLDKATRIMSSEYDCLVGDTLVVSPSEVHRAYRRPYSGQLVTITTAGGNHLTGTPNHPVLTDHGWRPLHSLREGDHVVRCDLVQDESARADPDVAHQPTPIAEVARALALASPGGSKRVVAVPVDFHGDVTHGYVDVVSAARLLRNGGDAACLDPVSELDGEGRHLEQPALVADGPGVESGHRPRWALRSAAGSSELPHPLPVGFRPAPGFGDTFPAGGQVLLPDGVRAHPFLPGGQRLFGGLPSDPPGGHFLLEPWYSDVDRRGDGQQSPLAGEVTLDRIVDVCVADAGPGRHVYNLETSRHWYVANGILSHNCAYVQEAIELTEADWEAITTRLRNGKVSFQQLIADTNPDAPTHWLKARCDRGQTVMLDCRHEDNPVLFGLDGHLTDVGRSYIGKLDNLTGVRYARLRKGRWVAAEGAIYEEWNSNVHLVDRFDIPLEWQRWWVVDFGYTNPMAIQNWAEDPDGRLYLYREIYHTKRTVDQHAADILACVRRPADHVVEAGREPDPKVHADWTWTEPKPRAIICDHDAEGRVVLSREVGIGTMAANKTVTAGIQVVQQRLRPAGDGRPRLFVLRDSLVRQDGDLVDAKRPTCTAEEFPGYVWDMGVGKAPKEVPVKDNDHGMDCVRYLAAARDIGSPRVRMMR